jgi:Flp pilus assembly protein TadD
MRCPVCKAENSQGPQCRRCKADLTLLFRLEAQQARALSRARALFQAGRFEQALRFAEGADATRRDNQTLELLAVLHLHRGDFARAWHFGQLRLAGERT